MNDGRIDEVESTQEEVDQHPNGPTEPDEMEVLTGLYGQPDSDGVFRVGDIDGDQ